MELKDKLTLLEDLKQHIKSTETLHHNDDSKEVLRKYTFKCICNFNVDTAKYLHEYFPAEYAEIVATIYDIQNKVLKLQKEHVNILDEHLEAINTLMNVDPQKCSLPE